MKSESKDEKYSALLADLRDKMKKLEQQIVPKVYEYGFLLNNNEHLPEIYQWEAEDQQEIEPAIEITENEPYITEAKQLLKVSKTKKSAVPSLAQVLKPVSGATNVNITVNINKFDVLWQAARCGLNVPDSYIVNSKMDLKDLTGKIISKSILDPILPSWGNKHKSMMYTTILDKNNFEHLPKMFNLDYFCMIHTMHISRYLHNIEKFEITKI